MMGKEANRPRPASERALLFWRQALGEARKHNSALQLLDLQHNQIGDTGAQAAWVRSYQGSEGHSSTLQELNLLSNQIGDAGA